VPLTSDRLLATFRVVCIIDDIKGMMKSMTHDLKEDRVCVPGWQWRLLMKDYEKFKERK
jgi:hypothetical protein